MLKLHDVNWFNLTNTRQVKTCPPHFLPVTFDRMVSEKEIANWIFENLEGRFWIGQVQTRSDQTPEAKLTLSACVAFEDHSESTYFALMINQINVETSIW